MISARNILRRAGLATVMLPSLALAAGEALGATERQPTNWTAIAMFAVFVALTLYITKLAASRTKSAAAKSAGRLKAELKKYTKPALLILDELGYLPIDKTGADLLFQVISLRYEQGALIITSNRAFKEWPTIFNHDSTLTSAVLDRLLHHADTIIIEGKSFRMKDQLES